MKGKLERNFMRIEQALYGERGGAHRLLAKSCDDKEPFEDLEFHTDRPGDLPPRVGWDPFVSGFELDGQWIFTKTFPDTLASRPGMVFTHALVIALDAVSQLSDIAPLLELLPAVLPPREERGSVESIEWDVPQTLFGSLNTSQDLNEASSEVPGFGAVVHALFITDGSNRSLVWVGQDEFQAVVQELWRRLSPALRQTFSFRHSFEAQDAERHMPTFLATPSQLASRWTDFTCVRPSDETDTPSPAEAFLRGLSQGEPVRNLLAQLQIEPQSLRQIQIAEECSRHLDADSNSVADARAVARLVSILAPSPAQGVAFKDQVLNRFCEATQYGGASDIMALRNFDTAPFQEGQRVQSVVRIWMAAHLLDQSRAEECVNVLQAAFSPPSPPVALSRAWAQEVIASVRQILEDWPRDRTQKAASVLWKLWKGDLSLVEHLEPLLPMETSRSISIEHDLAAACPTSVADNLGAKVLRLSERREWFFLHAKLLLVMVSSGVEGQFNLWQKQLSVDRDENKWEGLKLLAAHTSPKIVIETALITGDERVMVLAGQALARQSDLFVSIDVENFRWRRLWHDAIIARSRSDISPWEGVPDPQQIMFALCDQVLEKQVAIQDLEKRIESRLLLALSETPQANLLHYPRRAQVWPILQSIELGAATAFLEATAEGWWQKFSGDGGEEFGEQFLEVPLQNAVTATLRLKSKLEHAGGISFTLRVLQRFPSLPSSVLANWLDWWLSTRWTPSDLTADEAARLSELVNEREWHNVAQLLANNAQQPNLYAAAQVCGSLLPLFERLKLQLSTVSRGWGDAKGQEKANLTGDELWQLWSGLAADLYAWGPGDKNVWKKANGDESQLAHLENGRASWEAALRKLKNGGGGKDITVESLLREMREEFPRHEQLDFLWQHRKHLI